MATREQVQVEISVARETLYAFDERISSLEARLNMLVWGNIIVASAVLLGHAILSAKIGGR